MHLFSIFTEYQEVPIRSSVLSEMDLAVPTPSAMVTLQRTRGDHDRDTVGPAHRLYVVRMLHVA